MSIFRVKCSSDTSGPDRARAFPGQAHGLLPSHSETAQVDEDLPFSVEVGDRVLASMDTDYLLRRANL